MQPAAEHAARDLASANDQQANVENRRNAIEKLTREQIAGEVMAGPSLLPPWISPGPPGLTASGLAEQLQRGMPFGGWVLRTPRPSSTSGGEAANVESLESIEKLTREQIAGEVQTLQAATEKAARGLIASMGNSAEGFIVATEKAARGHLRRMMSQEQIAGEPQALQPAAEQAASSVEKLTKEQTTNDGQTSKSVEKLTKEQTKEQTTTMGQAASYERVLTKEQIESDLQALESVTAAAAADCVFLTLTAYHTKSNEKLTKEEITHTLLELQAASMHNQQTVFTCGAELLLKLMITEAASRLRGRDSGELGYVRTATENAMGIVNAFMAGFVTESDSEGEP